MSTKFRCTVLIAFLAIVKQATPLNIYVLEDTFDKRPVNQETSMYLKPAIKSTANIVKQSICQKRGILCLIPHLQGVEDVLRGGEDAERIDTKSSSYSEEHSDVDSSESDYENPLPHFHDLTRGSHNRAENIGVIRLNPVEIENTNLDVSKLTKVRNYLAVSGRKLGKINQRKHPKIIGFNDDSDKYGHKNNQDEESDDEDEDEEDESKAESLIIPQSDKENEKDDSKSEETRQMGENTDASPETEEQIEMKKKRGKVSKKPIEAFKKRLRPNKFAEKYKIPKRFEVVDNVEKAENKKDTNRGDTEEASDEKKIVKNSHEASNSAPEDTDIDLTVIKENDSIEKPTEKVELEDMIDSKEKYTYIQGLDRSVHVGKKKKKISEETPTAEDDKTTEEDKALLYRRAIPFFLPKRYMWSGEDYKNLGYFWFNGPQGKSSPGTYRIRYK